MSAVVPGPALPESKEELEALCKQQQATIGKLKDYAKLLKAKIGSTTNQKPHDESGATNHSVEQPGNSEKLRKMLKELNSRYKALKAQNEALKKNNAGNAEFSVATAQGLKAEIEEKNILIASLRANMMMMKEENSSEGADKEGSVAREEVEKLQKMLAEVKESKQALAGKAKQLLAKFNQTKKALIESEEQVKTLQNSHIEMKMDRDALLQNNGTDGVKNLHAQLEEKNMLIESLRADMMLLNQGAANAGTEQEDKLKRLCAEKDEVIQSLGVQKDQTIHLLQTEKTEALANLAARADELSVLRLKLQTVEKLNEDLKQSSAAEKKLFNDDLAEATLNIREKTKDFDRLKETLLLSEEEKGQLTVQVKRLRDALDDQSVQAKAALSLKANFEQKYTDLELSKQSELSSYINANKMELDKLKSKLDTLQNEAIDRQGELTATKNTLATVETEKASMMKEFEAYKNAAAARLDDRVKEVSREANNTVEKLKVEYDARIIQLESQKHEIEHSELHVHKEKLDDMRKRLQVVEDERGRLDAELETVKNESEKKLSDILAAHAVSMDEKTRSFETALVAQKEKVEEVLQTSSESREENALLKEQLDTMEKEQRGLLEQVDMYEARSGEHSVIAEEMNSLKESLQAKERKVQTLLEQISHLEGELKETTAAVESVRCEKDTIAAMCDKFKAKASELQESKKKVGGKAKDILEQLKETKAALSKVQSSEKALLKEVSELKSKSVRASDEYKDRLRETESDWSQKLARADKEAALKLRDLEVQITTLSDKLLDAEREGEETLKEIAHLKTTHHSLKEEKLNLSESIDVLQNENRDLLQSVQELKTKNEDQLNATNAAGRTEIDALRTECEKYKADYDILKERKSKLGEQAKQILAKLNQTKESLASKDAKVAQLSQELVASSAELDRLRGDVSAQNKERESENSNWENLVAELKATNVVLMEKVQSSNEKIADLMNESNSASGEINDTKSILASLIKEKEDLVETCESKDASIADIQDRLDRKQEMLQKLAARYKKVQEALAQSKAQLAQGHAAENSEFEEMKNKLQSMELKWSSRDKELIDKDDECIRLKKQLAEMQEAHAKNEESYEHNEKKYSSLEEKFEKMEADFESYKGKARAALKAQVDSDVHKVQELKNEMDALESAKAVAEKQANESKSTLKEILEKLKMAKTKHMESEGRAKELQKEIVELKEEITQFKEKIGEFAIVKERFRGQFQEEKEVLQTQINGLTERLNELTSTQKKDDHPSSMPENTPSSVGDIRSFNATMDLRTPPADTPDTFAPSLPANDWRSGMGIDALTAASLIEDALSGYQPPTTDRYGQLSAHELGGFKYDGEEDFTHAPSIFQSSSMMPSRELEESAAITAKQAKDESGKQENVLMAAVNSVVEEYSEYDILEKTDPTFSSMRTKLPLKEQLEEAIAQLAQLRQEHSEAKERNELHLAQENILKDEIRELRAQLSRDNSLVRGADSHINLEYLKNCVYQYMSTDEPEERLVLVDPISNILKFRKEEKEVVKKVASYEANATVLSSFTNFFSPYTPATQ